MHMTLDASDLALHVRYQFGGERVRRLEADRRRRKFVKKIVNQNKSYFLKSVGVLYINISKEIFKLF